MPGASTVVDTLGYVVAALAAVACIRLLRGGEVPRGYLLAVAALGLASTLYGLAVAPGLPALYPLGVFTGVVAALLLGGGGPGLTPLLALLGGAALAAYAPVASLDPRGGAALYAVLGLASLASGLVAAGYALREREERLVWFGAVLGAAALGVNAYWVAARTFSPYPPGGAVSAAALLAVLGGLFAERPWARLYGGYASAALGLVAAGFEPYSFATLPVVAWIGAVAVPAYLAAMVAWREARRLGLDALLGLVPPLFTLYAPVSGLLPGDAGSLEVFSAGVAGAALLLGGGWRRAAPTALLYYAGLAALAVGLLAPSIPIVAKCDVVALKLGPAAPAPKPSERVIHDFYLLYIGAKDPAALYSLLAPKLGEKKALQMARFCAAIGAAARAMGVNDTYPLYNATHPEHMPSLVAYTDCGVVLHLPPDIALCPATLEPGDVNITGYGAFTQPIHVILGNASCTLARDYLVMVSRPGYTGRDALRYAIYTAMLVSMGEGRNLTDTARLIFYYAFNPNATINETSVTIVYAERLHVYIAALAAMLLLGAALLAATYTRV